MRDNQIDRVFKYKTRTDILVGLNFEDARSNQVVTSNRKDQLLQPFLESCASFRQSISVVDDDELVRYIYALYIHRKAPKRLITILHDFTFGFYPVRDIGWLKNRLRFLKNVVKTEQTFAYFINRLFEKLLQL